MFRTMRRKNQILSQQENITILQKATSGTLALLGDDNYTYAIPLSYVYHDNKIFFHCAKTGHKIDAINKHNKVSFCVIAQDTIVPEKYTTYFKSVIVFGTAHILENESEKRNAIEIFAEKYSPQQKEGRLKEIDREFKQLCMIELNIEHISGKQAIELTKQNKRQI